MPDFRIEWNPLDEPTETEIADNNLKKAQHYRELLEIGAVGAEDITKAVIRDPKSGFDEVTPEEPYFEEEGFTGEATQLPDTAGAKIPDPSQGLSALNDKGQQAGNP